MRFAYALIVIGLALLVITVVTGCVRHEAGFGNSPYPDQNCTVVLKDNVEAWHCVPK